MAPRRLSPHAVSFLRALLCEAPERLGGGEGGLAELQSHPFFEGLAWAQLKAVDVGALGGRPPAGGKMTELTAALAALPRESPAFGPLLEEVCVCFDDFVRARRHTRTLARPQTPPPTQPALLPKQDKLSPSDPRALAALAVHPVGGNAEGGGARTTPQLLGFTFTKKA